jgi:hypothetical protein
MTDLFDYAEGKAAALEHRPCSDNPYGVGSDSYRHWRLAWLLTRSWMLDNLPPMHIRIRETQER